MAALILAITKPNLTPKLNLNLMILHLVIKMTAQKMYMREKYFKLFFENRPTNSIESTKFLKKFFKIKSIDF